MEGKVVEGLRLRDEEWESGTKVGVAAALLWSI